jgi:Fe-S-cluster containining protein
MHDRFGQILTAGRGHAGLVEAITSEAFDLFERNVAIQTENLLVLACHKGCPACCCIRVTATAPEIFLLAGYIRRVHETPAGAMLDLPGRIAKADGIARGLDPQQRMAAQCYCPFILKDSCVIHPIRPLACRGHAAFDKNACIEAAAGRAVEVPLSEPHAVIRSLVQNALQSALRAHGYAWRAYELNHALHLALMQADGEAEWSRGDDALAPALIEDTDWQALAMTFDQVICAPGP